MTITKYNNNNTSHEDEIDLNELLLMLWNKKLLITGTSLLFAVCAMLLALFFLPNIYKSHALLLPADQGQSNMGSLSQYSSMARLAGITIPSNEVDKSIEAIERIKSHEFFARYFLKNILLQDLLAVQKWDPSSNMLFYEENIFDSNKSIWIRDVGFPKSIIPSSQEAYKTYQKIINISQNDMTKFITISVKHQSPFIAKEWADIIIKEINKSMRDAEKKQTSKSIKFLNEQALTVNYEEIKKAISLLQQEQMKSLMLIEANEDYIFKIVDSPLVPEMKSGPNRFAIVLIGALFGAILSILFLVIINLLQRDNKVR